MDNWQEQIQELQAMRAIFGADFVVPGITSQDADSNGEDDFLDLPEGIGSPLEAQLLVHITPTSVPLAVQVCIPAARACACMT